MESHFKSVKHGRLEGRSRVRPRAFVTAELKYVLGKLNERKLPKERIHKSPRREAALTEEKRRRRKCSARYADVAVASKRLKTIRRRLGTEHITKDTTTVHDVTSAVDIHTNEMSNDEITTAMDQLRAVYPDIDGLQHPGLGLCRRHVLVVRPFVQVA